MRFKVLDTDGREGRPPEMQPQDISIAGELLPGAMVRFDAANGYWTARATPLGSDSDYLLGITWPDVGHVTFVVDLPQHSGAKAAKSQKAP